MYNEYYKHNAKASPDEIQSFKGKSAAPQYDTHEEFPSSASLAKTTTRKQKKSSGGGLPIVGSVAAAIFAAVMLVETNSPTPKVNLMSVVTYDQFSYALQIDAPSDATIVLRLKKGSKVQERPLAIGKDIQEESGTFADLTPETVYTFEVTHGEGLGKNTLVRKSFKTSQAPQKPEGPAQNMTDAVFTDFMFAHDETTQILTWQVAKTDPFSVLSNFTVSLCDKDGQCLRTLDFTGNFAQQQAFSTIGMTSGRYQIRIEADTIFPTDLAAGNARKTVCERFITIFTGI